MKSLIALGLAFGLIAAPIAADAAMPVALPAAPVQIVNPSIIQAADGCGPAGYRGPYGACHRYGYGPYPGGYYGPRPGWAPARAQYCGSHRVWVYGPYGGGHWAWFPNC